VALARIIMPQSMVRLSAGRTGMSDEVQALCFFAGANSLFLGDKLLTAPNPAESDDIKATANQKGKRLGYAVYQEAIKLGVFLRPLGNTIYWLPPP